MERERERKISQVPNRMSYPKRCDFMKEISGGFQESRSLIPHDAPQAAREKTFFVRKK
jgi:hypothetical protein